MLIMFVICMIGGILWGVLFRAGLASSGTTIDLMTALLSGLIFGAALFGGFMLIGRRQDRRIHAAAKKLPSPPSYSCSALLMQGKQMLTIGVFLCAECLCLVNLARKDLPVTIIPADDLVRAVLPMPNQLELHLTEGRQIILGTTAAGMLLEELKTRGWLPFQH